MYPKALGLDLSRFAGKHQATWPTWNFLQLKELGQGCRSQVTHVTALFVQIWDVRLAKTARWVMNDSIFFATFDPLYINAPDACSLCIAQPPAFNYEYCVEQSDGKRHYIKGFCCTACAAGLLKKLAGREAEEWAEEEAELQADDMDVTDLQKRRLATFGEASRR
jgi:hypothetical protein